jgi:hypothetical protein
VRIPRGRFELQDLADGASRKIGFQAFVDPSFAGDHCLFKVVLQADYDQTLEHEVRVDLAAPSATVEVDPPRLTLQGPTLVTGGVAHIEATAASDRGVHDVYVRVWNRNQRIPVQKVLYQLNQPSDGPGMSLALDVAVTRGMNLIQVFVRDANDVQSQRTLLVEQR